MLHCVGPGAGGRGWKGGVETPKTAQASSVRGYTASQQLPTNHPNTYLCSLYPLSSNGERPVVMRSCHPSRCCVGYRDRLAKAKGKRPLSSQKKNHKHGKTCYDSARGITKLHSRSPLFPIPLHTRGLSPKVQLMIVHHQTMPRDTNPTHPIRYSFSLPSLMISLLAVSPNVFLGIQASSCSERSFSSALLCRY